LRSGILAKRYAEAFFRTIESAPEPVVEDFRIFSELIRQKPEIATILNHPVIRITRKLDLLETLLPLSEHPSLAPFFRLLVQRRRFNLLERIEKHLKLLYRKKFMIVSALVKSALPLTREEKEKLTRGLSQKVGGTIELETQIDPTIQGGLLIHVGDMVLDSTVRTRLKHLQEKLALVTSELLRDMTEAPIDLI
jgi:F-type H+-transporting ATPase subunit delta